jgi:sterol-4alpha-carboxylate 3-dehydrogenase (decarboxylating)
MVETLARKCPKVTQVLAFDIAEPRSPFSAAAAPKVRFVQGDLCDGAALAGLLRQHAVRAVVHVASPNPNSRDAALFERVNVQGTQTMIDACKKAGVPVLVYTSSASVVWEGKGQVGVDESQPYPAAFRDPYAATKARAEAAVLAAGRSRELWTASVRPHAIYGPGSIELVETTAALCRSGRQKTIVGAGDNIVDWTYVGNVVHAHMLALQKGAAAASAADKQAAAAASGKAYFVTDGAPLPFWTFMNWLILGLGFDSATRRVPYALVLAIAFAAQAVVAVLNSALGTKIQLTLSPSRLQIAGTSHWYRIDAARADLGYAPLWPTKLGLFLTLKSFAHLANREPSARTVAKARAGNLVRLGLVRATLGSYTDFAKSKGSAAPTLAALSNASSGAQAKGVERGANQASETLDPATLPAYTMAQVAEHKTDDDLWLVIRWPKTGGFDYPGQALVYDLTSYVEKHPGELAIMNNAGGDATKGFLGPQHPETAFATVRKFLIGRLKE